MTPQDHADHLLAIWQQKRAAPNAHRIAALDAAIAELRAYRDVAANRLDINSSERINASVLFLRSERSAA